MNTQAMYETLTVVEWLKDFAEVAAWALPALVLALAVATLIRPRLADVRVTLLHRHPTPDGVPKDAFLAAGDAAAGAPAGAGIDGVSAAGAAFCARRASLVVARWARGLIV